MQQSYLSKVNNDHLGNSEQFSYLKERVRLLESDLEAAIRQKTDAQFEVRKLTTNLETMEKNMQELKLSHMKAQGDTQNSSATVQRLQT